MADSEVGDLTAAGTLSGDEIIHVVKSGNSRKTTVDEISNLVKAEPVFTGDAEFENISDGSTAIDAIYVVKGSAKAIASVDGSTPNLEKNLNVSSLIDNGAGDYTLNFTNYFDDAEYVVGYFGEIGNFGATRTVSAFRYIRKLDNGVASDGLSTMSIFGDLAE
jgi:hypothetical protein